MCAELDDLIREYDQDIVTYAHAGYTNVAYNKRLDKQDAIRDHRKRCPTCRQELGMAQAGIQQGRVR
jgi:hypothetical protein